MNGQKWGVRCVFPVISHWTIRNFRERSIQCHDELTIIITDSITSSRITALSNMCLTLHESGPRIPSPTLPLFMINRRLLSAFRLEHGQYQIRGVSSTQRTKEIDPACDDDDGRPPPSIRPLSSSSCLLLIDQHASVLAGVGCMFAGWDVWPRASDWLGEASWARD